MRGWLLIAVSLAACIDEKPLHDDGGAQLEDSAVHDARLVPPTPDVDVPSSDAALPPDRLIPDVAAPPDARLLTPDLGPELPTQTHVGLEFWAVDLANAFGSRRKDGVRLNWGVVLLNPGADMPARVTITDHWGRQIEAQEIPPGTRRTLRLPSAYLGATVLGPLSLRIRSDVPVAVWQFNPIADIEDMFSNDASLLFPTGSLGRRYVVLSREQGFARLKGYLTVLATQDGPTDVTVTVTAPTRASADGEIAAMSPGDTLQVRMEPYDVLNLATDAPGADLTGSFVEASAPAGVAVRLNGEPLGEAAETVGDSWWVYRLEVDDGFHRISADAPVSVEVYGFEEYVSFGYAGGVDLSER